MATVAVRANDEDRETSITHENFRSWKRKHGRDTAFVVQMPGADEEDDRGVLVRTFGELKLLPAGSYSARLVRRCEVPEAAKKDLRGSDLWKCV